MQVTTKKITEGQLQLSIELDRTELQTYITQIEKEALAEVQVDGFRKGKAPENIGREQLDKQKLLQVALESALEKSLREATAKENLDVFKISDLTISENSANRLAYSVKATLFPVIALPDLSLFKVSRKPINVDDREIEDTIDVIRDSRATFTPKEEPAATGDRVEVDFEVKLDGKVIEGGESKNHPLIIGGKNFMPGFEDNLVGMKKSESKSFSLTAPVDYYQKSLAGKKLDFNVTVKNIQTVVKPELSDSFAQTLGKFENVDQLRGGIREGVYEEKRMKEKQRVRLEVLDGVIKTADIKLPEPFIEEQLNTMLAGFERDLAERGMELGIYLAHLNKTQDDLRREWRAEAERQAKITLIIHKVSRDKSIVATNEEIATALNQSVQAIIARGQVDPSQLDLEKARHSIAEQITSEKTLDFIEGICVTG